MKTISIPTNNRPHYLARVLDSLKSQPEIGDYKLVFSCEPGCDEVISQIIGIDWADRIFRVNATQLGTDRNTLTAVSLAFHLGSSFNVYLEDDYIMSPDALLMANAFEQLKPQGLMLNFRRGKEDLGRPQDITTDATGDGLMGCGFCCEAGAFPILERWWLQWPSGLDHEHGWDWAVAQLAVKEGFKVWRPLVNRTQHIGINGTNTTLEKYDNPPLSGPCFQGRVQSFNFIS